jgi:uncharacterized sodium:solute symporter family permease YidK
VIVQRVLSAKNFTHAKAGCVFAAWLKFLPLFLIVLPGMIARVLFAGKVSLPWTSNGTPVPFRYDRVLFAYSM